MRIKLCLLSFCWFLGLSAQQFSASRKLELGQPGWYQLVPNAQLAAELRPRYADMRIIGITTNGDTIEAPWMPQQQKAVTGNTWRAFEVINQSQKEGLQFYTFRYTGNEPISEINLDLEEENFDYHLTLEGRQNSEQDWFTILQQYRLVGYSDERMSFKKTILRFKPQKHQEFRISFKPNKTHRLLAATYPYLHMAEQAFTNIDQSTFKLTKNTEKSNKKVDFYRLSFAQPTCFNALQVRLAANYDYLRQAFFYRLGDSVMEKNKRVAHYDYLEQVYFHNYGDSLITLSENYCGCEFEFRITHNDNQPIAIAEFIPMYRPEALLVRIDEPARWQMFYGDAKLQMPDYDIRSMAANPSPIGVIAYGSKQSLSPTALPSPQTAARPWMLWLIMTLIGSLIVFFAYQLLTKPVVQDKD